MMKKLVSFFVLIVFCVSARFCCAQVKDDNRLNVVLSTEYLIDNLTWSVAGNTNGQNPNVLSELTWKKLQTPGISLKVEWMFASKLQLNVSLAGSTIVSGTVTDIDYSEDNRVRPVFHASLASDKGTLYSYHVNGGYSFVRTKVYNGKIFVGYGINHQQLYLTDDVQLNSTYTNKWSGIVFSLENSFHLNSRNSFFIQLTYHQVNYGADGNWNLIEEFMHPVSFTHSAKGFGIEPGLQYIRLLNSKLSLFVHAASFHWSTGKGIDKLYLRNGNVVVTQLNDVTRKGFKASSGVMFHF